MSRQASSKYSTPLWELWHSTLGTHYLLGTIHSGAECAMPWLSLSLPYLSSCERFFAESHLDELSRYEFPLSDGSDLLEILGDRAYAKMKRILQKSLAIRLDDYRFIRPFWLNAAIQLKMIDPTSSAPAMDHQLWQVTQQHGISCDGLESAEEQAEIYQALDNDGQMKQLRDTCRHISRSRRRVQKLSSLYQQGAIFQLYRVTRSQLGAHRELMLTKRNQRMAERIINHADGPKAFFSCGAAHLCGSSGVLSILKRSGMVLKPVTEDIGISNNQ